MTNECKECKILMAAGHRHARGCSQFVELPAVPYGRDGFVRDAKGNIEGFATGNRMSYGDRLQAWLDGAPDAILDRHELPWQEAA